MMLGKLPVPGCPAIRITVGQGPTALAVVAGGGCLDIFTLLYPFFPLSPSLWKTARYRRKYCLKGPKNPKPTNQPNYISVNVPFMKENWLAQEIRNRNSLMQASTWDVKLCFVYHQTNQTLTITFLCFVGRVTLLFWCIEMRPQNQTTEEKILEIKANYHC